MSGTGWSPAKIKAELKARNITLASIARELNITDSAVHHCINQRYPLYKGYRVRRAIAEHLGVPVDRIWPNSAGSKAC